MLMYDFHPYAPIDVNIHRDELQIIQNIQRDMQHMLHIARDNLQREIVFICVPRDSMLLTWGNYAKLVTVLKHICSFAYYIDLPLGIKVHHVFHVICLKEVLGSNDNSISIKTLVTLAYFSAKPHRPKRTLD